MALRQEFQHDPLESPERQIRLLEIKASDNGDTEYQLTTYILGSAHMPRFYALSYEWGTDSPAHALTIDGKSFKIRDNLRLFLDRVRSERQDFVRPMWIDAICIDQTSTTERNEQVKIMGQIFRAATLVLTWLGPKSIDDATLVETESTLQDWRHSAQYTRIKSGGSKERPKIVSLRDPYGPMWNCLHQLSQLTYWKRRWIIQELIKAKKLLFLWGVGQLTWEALSAAFRAVHTTSPENGSSDALTGPWDAIRLSIPYSVWQHYQGFQDSNRLLQIMHTYRDSQCSVYHDKAYALTGISADADQVQVDYAKSLPDLYADLMGLEPRSPYFLKYSKLILDALCIDRRKWAEGPVAGRVVSCKGIKISPITAVAILSSPITPQLIETEFMQMFSRARRASLFEIDTATKWAKDVYADVGSRTSGPVTVSYFILLDGRVGMSMSSVEAGDVLYMVQGATEDTSSIYLRQSGSSGRANSIPSPRSSVPSLHGGPTTSRAWLSSPTEAEALNLNMSDTIEVRLGDLYDMNHTLEWDILPDTPLPSPTEAPSSPQLKLRRPYSDSSEIRSPRGSTVSSSIDGPLRHRLLPSFTWPSEASNTDGWYIDALARDMRAKLFTGPTKLNTPD